MKNKKGFTLMELLAVIAIIAILAILIIPNVLGKYNSAKEETFKVQVGNLLRAAEMQKQSDMLAGNTALVYCFGTDICDSENPLNITESDIKYVVVFNSSGQVSKIAIENTNYCYIKSVEVSEINKNDFIKGGRLSCTGTNCECIVSSEGSNNSGNNNNGNNSNNNNNQPTATSYKYWSSPQMDSEFSFYTTSQKPTTTYDDPALTGAVADTGSTPFAYIRTSMNGETPTGHQACIRMDGKDACISPNVSNSDLQTIMSTGLNRTDGSCSLNNDKYTCSYAIDPTACTSGSGIQCTMARLNGISCFVTTWGDVACSDGLNSNGCVVYNDGTSSCFANGGLNKVTFKEPGSGSGSGTVPGNIEPGEGMPVYWSYYQGRVNGQTVTFTSTSKPATTYSALNLLANTSEFSPYNSFQYIKTLTDTDGNATSHQACLYYSGKSLCLGANYWAANATLTKAKLETAMNNAFSSELLSFESITCNISSENKVVSCYLPGSDLCEVNSSGEARCRAALNGTPDHIWCRVNSSSSATCEIISATTTPDPNDPTPTTY